MVRKSIGVLVVDDSAVIREIISDLVEATPDMRVVGRAPNGQRAVEMVETRSPDVVTLDIQMPMMDGLSALEAMLQKRPVPVIMVSSLTKAGADITLDALDRGAIDYIAKPTSPAETQKLFARELIEKIRAEAGTNVARILQIRREQKMRRGQRKKALAATSKVVSSACPQNLADKCIALGISTGGPPALASLLPSLRPPMPPIVIVQHMPSQFTKSLAWRLDSLSALSVREAEATSVLRPNHVLIAPGGRHLILREVRGEVRVSLNDKPPVSGHKPSVDVMMHSAAKIYGSRCLGVIMTGMGRDGSDGCRAIRAAGGYVLGQDEATSDVYGMNKVAFIEGNVDRQFNLNEAAGKINLQMRHLWTKQTLTV